MKDFEVELRIRNNRLVERRRELGFSQGRLGEAAGVSQMSVSGLECMSLSPRRKDGAWREPALKLARFYCVEPEELFPEAVGHVVQSVITKKVNAEDIPALAGSGVGEGTALLLTGNPHHVVEDRQMRRDLRRAIFNLSPTEEEILKDFFGLDGRAELTLDEIGAKHGVTGGRILQIKQKALRRLRYPKGVGGLLVQHCEG